MKRALISFVISMAFVLSLTGCGSTADLQAAAEKSGLSELAGNVEPLADTGRQDGERFEDVIILEGTEETVRYEHIRNDKLGFEMEYDYEAFVRYRESDREYFISAYDDPDNPEAYLEVKYSPEDAETVSASLSGALANDYDIVNESISLDRAGSCIRIDASDSKGDGGMPDFLQTVYVIPAADGCRVATVHCSFESTEGFGRRVSYIMNTLVVIARNGNVTD